MLCDKSHLLYSRGILSTVVKLISYKVGICRWNGRRATFRGPRDGMSTCLSRQSTSIGSPYSTPSLSSSLSQVNSFSLSPIVSLKQSDFFTFYFSLIEWLTRLFQWLSWLAWPCECICLHHPILVNSSTRFTFLNLTFFFPSFWPTSLWKFKLWRCRFLER